MVPPVLGPQEQLAAAQARRLRLAMAPGTVASAAADQVSSPPSSWTMGTSSGLAVALARRVAQAGLAGPVARAT